MVGAGISCTRGWIEIDLLKLAAHLGRQVNGVARPALPAEGQRDREVPDHLPFGRIGQGVAQIHPGQAHVYYAALRCVLRGRARSSTLTGWWPAGRSGFFLVRFGWPAAS